MQGSWNLSAPRSMWVMVLLAAGLASAPAALGQTPTAAQAEMFRDLDPEQQRTVLEAMGAAGGQSGTTRSDPRVESPSTVLPRSTEDKAPSKSEPRRRAKAGSWGHVDRPVRTRDLRRPGASAHGTASSADRRAAGAGHDLCDGQNGQRGSGRQRTTYPAASSRRYCRALRSSGRYRGRSLKRPR